MAGKVGRVILGAFLAEDKAGLTPAEPVEAGHHQSEKEALAMTAPFTETHYLPLDTAMLALVLSCLLWRLVLAGVAGAVG